MQVDPLDFIKTWLQSQGQGLKTDIRNTSLSLELDNIEPFSWMGELLGNMGAAGMGSNINTVGMYVKTSPPVPYKGSKHAIEAL